MKARQKPELRKITVLVPRDLVERATKASGSSLTEAVRRGLESVAAADAFERIRELRGKVHLSINVDELREDKVYLRRH